MVLVDICSGTIRRQKSLLVSNKMNHFTNTIQNTGKRQWVGNETNGERKEPVCNAELRVRNNVELRKPPSRDNVALEVATASCAAARIASRLRRPASARGHPIAHSCLPRTPSAKGVKPRQPGWYYTESINVSYTLGNTSDHPVSSCPWAQLSPQAPKSRSCAHRGRPLAGAGSEPLARMLGFHCCPLCLTNVCEHFGWLS